MDGTRLIGLPAPLVPIVIFDDRRLPMLRRLRVGRPILRDIVTISEEARRLWREAKRKG